MALYLAQKLPSMLKKMESYSKKDYKSALTELFLAIDKSIITPEVLSELQSLAKKHDGVDESGTDYAEENVSALYEEATMPLSDLVEKYKSGGVDVDIPEEEVQGEKPCSSKSVSSTSKDCNNGPGRSNDCGSSSNSKSETTASCSGDKDVQTASSSSAGSSSYNSLNNHTSSSATLETEAKCTKNDTMASDVACSANSAETADTSKSIISNGTVKTSPVSDKCPDSTVDDTKLKNNGTSDFKAEDAEDIEGQKIENGSVTPEVSKGAVRKGKVFADPALMQQMKKEVARRISPRKIMLEYKNFFAGSFDSSDSDEDDDEDANLNENDDLDDDDSDDDCGAQQNSSSSEEDEDDDEDDDDEAEDDRFLNDMQEPGFDSGATAVVSYMTWESEDKMKVWVANVGDSRYR